MKFINKKFEIGETVKFAVPKCKWFIETINGVIKDIKNIDNEEFYITQCNTTIYEISKSILSYFNVKRIKVITPEYHNSQHFLPELREEVIVYFDESDYRICQLHLSEYYRDGRTGIRFSWNHNYSSFRDIDDSKCWIEIPMLPKKYM